MKKEKYTPAERKTALELLANIIEAGERGIAEPELLFRTSILARNMDFELESVKTAVLAEHWRSIPAHRARRATAEQVLGQSFRLVNGSLQKVELPPSEIRRLAWQDLLTMVTEAPRGEGEEIYLRAEIVARIKGGNEYYEELIGAIVESEKLHPEKLTSYAYATLAKVYGVLGSTNWRSDYLAATVKSLKRLKQESPAASWYKSCVRIHRTTAKRLNLYIEFLDLASREGLPSEFFEGDQAS